MFDNEAVLSALDSRGYTVLEALTPGPRSSPSTYSKPSTFICVDGKTYWVKASVQQGLVAELISGGLAAQVRAGPAARIIRVTPQVAQMAGAPELAGIVVGTEDVPDAVNARDLEPFIQDGRFDPGLLDSGSRMLVVAFQTWLGVQDSQVLIKLTTGAVLTIDHGDTFGNTGALTEPQVVCTHIPGVDDTVGREHQQVRRAVARIEAISDRSLLEAVARVPAGEAWRSPI